MGWLSGASRRVLGSSTKITGISKTMSWWDIIGVAAFFETLREFSSDGELDPGELGLLGLELYLSRSIYGRVFARGKKMTVDSNIVRFVSEIRKKFGNIKTKVRTTSKNEGWVHRMQDGASKRYKFNIKEGFIRIGSKRIPITAATAGSSFIFLGLMVASGILDDDDTNFDKRSAAAQLMDFLASPYSEVARAQTISEDSQNVEEDAHVRAANRFVELLTAFEDEQDVLTPEQGYENHKVESAATESAGLETQL